MARNTSATTPPKPCNNAHDERVASNHSAELVALVNLVADQNSHEPFTPEQRAEAIAKAIANPVAALECFRSLAERDGLTVH